MNQIKKLVIGYIQLKKIKEDFLLMYGDNYSPINLIKHFLFLKNKSLITLSVSKKNGNVKFLPGNKIKYYSKRDSKLSFVEIGYMICSKKIFNFVNNKMFHSAIILTTKIFAINSMD